MTGGEGVRFRIPLMLRGALALALCLLALRTALAGEVIYKSIEPNGEISYSWRPDPGALQIEPIDIDTLTPEQRRAMRRFQREEIEAGQDANENAVRLEEQWTRVDDEITQAQAELRQAETALRAGRTPLPGERRGNARGGSRLTQAYFDRLRDLELGVDRAKRRLDDAYVARNALK